jgi:predicted nucleic acid-binding protein
MPDDAPSTLVVDASVAAKLWFDEGNVAAAASVFRSGRSLVAPAIFHAEIASLASKRLRRGLSPPADADRAMAESKGILDRVYPIVDLAQCAFELARDHGISAYDGLYLALAERVEAVLLTADARLALRARASDPGHLVTPLGGWRLPAGRRKGRCGHELRESVRPGDLHAAVGLSRRSLARGAETLAARPRKMNRQAPASQVGRRAPPWRSHWPIFD